jgi:plasmid stability protein
MAQLVVPDIDDDVMERLQRRAKKHGCSLEELVCDILRDAAKDAKPTGDLGSEIADLFKHGGFPAEVEE